MCFGSDVLREYLVLGLDIVRRRWLLFCVPVALGIMLAAVATMLAPTKYTASSLILLQAANRNVGTPGQYNFNTLEQVQAIGAWLKSDQVLSELVPQMSGFKEPGSPAERVVQMKVLGASLSLDLVGSSVLEVKLESRQREGLGRNLEIILSRLMEGLTGPEKNVFSAPQFVQMRRNEDVEIAEAALTRALVDEGFETPAQTRAQLHELWMLQRQHAAAAGAGLPPAEPNENGARSEAEQQIRGAISPDSQQVDRLSRLYGAFQEALARQATLQLQARPVRSNYVSIFSSPDDLLIIGRPKDPLVGENSGRKLAAGLVLLSVLGGAGLVLLAEIFHGILRTRREHEDLSGLPVVARMARIRGAHPSGAAI